MRLFADDGDERGLQLGILRLGPRELDPLKDAPLPVAVRELLAGGLRIAAEIDLGLDPGELFDHRRQIGFEDLPLALRQVLHQRIGDAEAMDRRFVGGEGGDDEDEQSDAGQDTMQHENPRKKSRVYRFAFPQLDIRGELRKATSRV